MEKIKKENKVLHTYTAKEEKFNVISHICGVILGIVAIVLFSKTAIKHQNLYGLISGVVFGISTILLYAMSSIYHGLKPNTKAKKTFQIIDHCSIFILISGAYTPFALCILREDNQVFGWTILSIIWAVSIIGIILNIKDLKKYRKISMFCYLAMGWSAIIKINVLFSYLGKVGSILLVTGGVIYSIGAIFYALGKKYKWMHLIFHIACLLASFLHMLCVLFYIL